MPKNGTGPSGELLPSEELEVHGRLLKALLGAMIGAFFGFVLFVLTWLVANALVGPVYGAYIPLYYGMGLGALLGLFCGLARLRVDGLGKLIAAITLGGSLGLLAGLIAGDLLYAAVESDPALYFKIFNSGSDGRPVGSLCILIITPVLGMLAGAVFGSRSPAGSKAGSGSSR